MAKDYTIEYTLNITIKADSATQAAIDASHVIRSLTINAQYGVFPIDVSPNDYMTDDDGNIYDGAGRRLEDK